MFAHIRGIVEDKEESYIDIDVNGVGYQIYMAQSAMETINIGDKIKVYTYLRLTQDDISLYGFLTKEDKIMFELLISVGGIGAKSAISILSNITASEFALYVITEDYAELKKLPGIGPKTAQRIVLELKDKIKKENTVVAEKELKKTIERNEKEQNAVDALIVLGYKKTVIEKALEEVDTSNLTLEEIIKTGLKLLAR